MAATTAAVVGAGAAVYGASKSAKASGKAGEAQAEASEAGIAEQRRQFDAISKLLEPYVTAGTGALGQQQAILGLSGANAQRDAISGIENSPYFQSVAKQSENAMLQNASATGGLRGGNIQGALAQYRPQLLNQLVQQQYQNLGGITAIGQNSAAQTGNAGMQSANNISGLLAQQGQARAGGILGQANAQNQMINSLIGIGGAAYGAGAF
ncbi:hypothetical protein SAMN03159489_05964 [Pseudomonas sp. NFPP07]|uniref:hypothetical protein n=1 Tax=Pseudomonas sp. NFPP07 TaxID=1566213 RepID=UPI0008EBDBC9|nr:hypothetical protein [Pseudomonas sp. NFPP07]SFQ82458.1 hypothetical protein SAMN03159489_05964 [Pseudomonas sp. NFPP07]